MKAWLALGKLNRDGAPSVLFVVSIDLSLNNRKTMNAAPIFGRLSVDFEFPSIGNSARVSCLKSALSSQKTSS